MIWKEKKRQDKTTFTCLAERRLLLVCFPFPQEEVCCVCCISPTLLRGGPPLSLLSRKHTQMQSATATDKDEVKEASAANGYSEQHLASTVDPPADKLAQPDLEEGFAASHFAYPPPHKHKKPHCPSHKVFPSICMCYVLGNDLVTHTEEDVPKKEQAALWRRNKMSDKERYEEVFTFEVNGRGMTIHQDMANELATVGLTVWDAVSSFMTIFLFLLYTTKLL